MAASKRDKVQKKEKNLGIHSTCTLVFYSTFFFFLLQNLQDFQSSFSPVSFKIFFSPKGGHLCVGFKQYARSK